VCSSLMQQLQVPLYVCVCKGVYVYFRVWMLFSCNPRLPSHWSLNVSPSFCVAQIIPFILCNIITQYLAIPVW